MHIPNQIDWFSLSQCSNSGLIRMSSVDSIGFSNGNVSSRRCNGSLSCHVNNITKSIDSNPETMVYNFHGSTFFWNKNHFKWNQRKSKYFSFFFCNAFFHIDSFIYSTCLHYVFYMVSYLWILFLFSCESMNTPHFTEHCSIG